MKTDRERVSLVVPAWDHQAEQAFVDGIGRESRA